MGDDENQQLHGNPTNRPVGSAFCRSCCGRDYEPVAEKLEYDYTRDDSSGKQPQAFPRIRSRGERYVDSYNDQPWACSMGTNEEVRERKKKQEISSITVLVKKVT